MNIAKLRVNNFRNFSNIELNLSPSATIIYGNNGHGKTNLLESLYYLSFGKSFRAPDKELSTFGAKHFLLQAEINYERSKKTLSCFYENKGHKILKINHSRVNQNNFIGQLKSVSFTPDDVGLIYGEPDKRRRLINDLISQLDSTYTASLSNYKRILNQRNHILFRISEGYSSLSELEIWNIGLIKEGSKIIDKRQEVISRINKIAKDIFEVITGTNESFLLEYASSIDPVESKNSFYKSLYLNQERDLKECTTTAGPHRDDIVFVFRGRSAAVTASRGEFRAMVLSLKLAELQLIEEATGLRPVLLLDDVFSELDKDRKKFFCSAIQKHQVFITSAEDSETINEYFGNVEMVNLNNGLLETGNAPIKRAVRAKKI